MKSQPQEVRSLRCRRILNSHAKLTTEFTVELKNGSSGIGASPQGETIGVYEDKSSGLCANGALDEILKDRSMEGPLSQADFDLLLQNRLEILGRNNCWALSLAFFNASHPPLGTSWSAEEEGVKKFPGICLNVLNGGGHAYTNPVLSDFAEYLLVPKFNDVRKLLADHANIQNDIRENLLQNERIIVNHNPVYRFRSTDNAECLRFLREVLDRLGLSGDYGLMIDASAGDLKAKDGYKFLLTDGSTRSTFELVDYWTDLIDEFGIFFLEDPFQEQDYEGWKALTNEQSSCKIIGDNFYSSDADRIKQGSLNGYTHGVIIKPNQAGTVTAVLRAIEASQRWGQIPITSHRSISTESTFLAPLTVLGRVRYMKIGPLYTDYSSVMRFNELIRLTGVELG